jgi:hypothetical protein
MRNAGCYAKGGLSVTRPLPLTSRQQLQAANRHPMFQHSALYQQHQR